MRNTPAGQGRGVDCQLASDSASYTRNHPDAQTAATVARRCETCRHFLDYADASNRGECRHRSPRLPDPFAPNAVWPVTAKFEWCGDWERREFWEAGHG